jgi:hypothetical protein
MVDHLVELVERRAALLKAEAEAKAAAEKAAKQAAMAPAAE